MRKWLEKAAALLAAFMLVSPLTVRAVNPEDVVSDGMFHLVDFETGTVDGEGYETFREAKAVYNNVKDKFVNLAIVKDGVTYEAEYALAIFSVNDACDFEVGYTNVSDGTEGAVNGCYGVDAAYLYTDDEGEYVTFSLSGVTAQAKLGDVKVVPLQNVYMRMTMFTVRSGNLFHMIKAEMEDDYYAYIIDHGPAPSYLEEGRAYYSYDGHYFYGDDQLYIMLDDYRNGIRDNSVNPEDPWYDWYQFVSHRTITNATAAMMDEFIENIMGVHSQIDSFRDNDKDGNDDILSQSQLYGMSDIFFQSQYEFGTNALMMLAISMNESASGRSSLSFTRNNLYSHAAYDSEEEAAAGRYYDIRTSVYSHAKYYLSGSYLSPMKEVYNGGFFGNKSAGMNVRYSSDPYWGEKAAAVYRDLDEELGTKDCDHVKIGIRTVEDETIVYQEPDGRVPLYATGSMPDMAFVILDEIENENGKWYKIQSDATLDESRMVDLSYYYRWKDDYAYIKADSVQIIIGEKTPEREFVNITFEGNGGTFVGNEENVSYQLPLGSDAVVSVPGGENMTFDSWDMDTSHADADMVYTASYKNTDGISFVSLPKDIYETNDRIDLRGGNFVVHVSGGGEIERKLTSSMVSGFDMSTPTEQEVTVKSDGVESSYKITVSKMKDLQRAEIKEKILGVIDQYGEKEVLEAEDVDKVLAVKKEMDETVQPYLTQQELRTFDRILRLAYADRIRYIVPENEIGFGVSGLSVSLPLEEGQLDKRQSRQDTFEISIQNQVSPEAQEALQKEAEYLRETVIGTYTVTMKKNLESFETDATLLFTINRPADSVGGDVYTVLAYTRDGDVMKCYTRQTTNTISFIGEGTGEYLVMSRNTSNQYVGEDPVEAVTVDTSSVDIRLIIANITAAFILLVVIVFLVIHFLGKHRKRRVIATVKKERKEKEENSKDLEITQAIEILNTEMIRLEEIRKAEEEMKNNDQHDGSSE